MIVVDTNIIGYLLLDSSLSETCEAVLKADPQWAAPRLWRNEMRSVLGHYIRKGILSLADAKQIMTQATRLMQGSEYEVPSNQVLDLADASTCSAYDCEFVALARDLQVPLVTSDRQILKEFSETAIAVDDFVTAG